MATKKNFEATRVITQAVVEVADPDRRQVDGVEMSGCKVLIVDNGKDGDPQIKVQVSVGKTREPSDMTEVCKKDIITVKLNNKNGRYSFSGSPTANAIKDMGQNQLRIIFMETADAIWAFNGSC